MAWRLKWTEAALEDIDKAAEFIGRDSKFYAAAFVREVRKAAKSLKTFAMRGRIVPELGREHIREVIVRNYRVIYSAEEDLVSILGVIHGARDLWVLWDKEGRG